MRAEKSPHRSWAGGGPRPFAWNRPPGTWFPARERFQVAFLKGDGSEESHAITH